MTIRTHELHPSIVHAPLALVPAAGVVDLLAALSPSDDTLDAVGRGLWWAAAGSGLAAGLAGMAASQEIELDDARARDMMFLHGMGNFGLVLGAFGVAAWRSANDANLTSAITGLAATGALVYTAYLGGELVYTHGAGVTRLGGAAAQTPPLFSSRGVARLARDSVRGLGWLLARGFRAVTGRQKIDRTALAPMTETGPTALAQHPQP